MKTINFGRKKFRLLNDNNISRSETTRSTWLFFPVIALILYFGFAAVGRDFKWFNSLWPSPKFLFLSLMIALLLSAGIVWGTRLFKKKIVINRNDQTVSSSLLFNFGKRCADYSDMEPNKVYIRGSHNSAFDMYLAEKKISEKTLKPCYINYIKYSEYDEDFLSDLTGYMNYDTSFEKSLNTRKGYRQRISEEQKLDIKIRKLEGIVQKSSTETYLLAESYYKKALACVRLNDFESAESAIRKAVSQAVKIQSERLDFYCELVSQSALIYFRQDKSDRALKQFRIAFDAFGDPNDLHGIALCHTKMGNLDKAKKALSLLFKEWESGETLIFMSDLLLLDSRKDLAIKQLERVLKTMEETEDEDLDIIRNYYENIEEYTVDISKTLKRESSILFANFQI
ncbi:MAG: hypothetical protein PQJ46_03760 [Spirochaetales bacterium]|nr:hypothetical protein [Spirochaetales bacterium]